MWTCCEGLERSSLTWKISTCFVFCWFFFSGWLALFRWLGINTLHYFGERHWSAYLIALLTMMAVIIVWLNPRCFLSLLFFSEKKKWSTHRKSERCRTILNHFIKSTFKWMCTFFRYTLRKNNFSLKKNIQQAIHLLNTVKMWNSKRIWFLYKADENKQLVWCQAIC